MEEQKEPVTLFEKSRDVGSDVMVFLTCAVIGLGGRGVIKTWTEVAARVRLYLMTTDLTSLVPPQFSHWLQVRKAGTVYLFVIIIIIKKKKQVSLYGTFT